MKLYTLDLCGKYHSSKEVHEFLVRAASYATAEQIAQAHPKCGTCDYYGLNHPGGWNECINEDSPYMERHDGMIDKDVDYCRFHSELTEPHTPQEEQR